MRGLAEAERKVPIFTLADAVKLISAAEGAPKNSIDAIKYKEAVLGEYLHSDESAAKKKQWIETGSKKHGRDNPNGIDSTTGKPGGKLPGHITFSDQSPYSIGLAAATGGHWGRNNEGDFYIPTKPQWSDPEEQAKLKRYFASENENGMLVSPNSMLAEAYTK